MARPIGWTRLFNFAPSAPAAGAVSGLITVTNIWVKNPYSGYLHSQAAIFARTVGSVGEKFPYPHDWADGLPFSADGSVSLLSPGMQFTFYRLAESHAGKSR